MLPTEGMASESGLAAPRVLARSRSFRSIRRWAVAAIFGSFAVPAAPHPPSGIVLDAQGNVLFLPWGATHAVLKLDPQGKVSTLVHDERLRELHHLVVGPGGDVLTASPGRLWRLGDDGDVEEVLADVDMPDRRRRWATGLGARGNPFAVDRHGTVCFFQSAMSSEILKVSPPGAASPFTGGRRRGHADGQGEAARFRYPHAASMVFGPDGRLYITDGTGVRVVSSEGRVFTLAGGDRSGYVDGRGTDARFAGLLGLDLDDAGNLYVADAGNFRVRRISPGAEVRTVAGSGARHSQDGPAPRASFFRPSGVAAGRDGELYVLDHGQRGTMVRKVADGVVTTLCTVPGGRISRPRKRRHSQQSSGSLTSRDLTRGVPPVATSAPLPRRPTHNAGEIG